ncbi:unnamed protein product, partial [Vitis vinifera]|uniref:GIR1-like zinc ribbon domain-containing protein n=1 Tax=Vitis vinifera TaxID=29760 RepID=D7T0Y5_VITVI
MAADVTSVVRILGGYKDDPAVGSESGNSTVLITRDLLGGGGGGLSSKLDSQELDLDLKVPDGWEKRLDLKSGKVYLQRCNSPMSSSSSSQNKHHPTNETVPTLQDLNFPPNPKPTLNLFEDTNLDLKLVPSSFNYPSVCTLDKVKSALERAERSTIKKRSSSMSKSSSLYFTAGCPGCLLYVLISKNNPKCPRCNSVVPTPATTKKPRIDLNISI